jgi:hypothetical protein
MGTWAWLILENLRLPARFRFRLGVRGQSVDRASRDHRQAGGIDPVPDAGTVVAQPFGLVGLALAAGEGGHLGAGEEEVGHGGRRPSLGATQKFQKPRAQDSA